MGFVQLIRFVTAIWLDLRGGAIFGEGRYELGT
jgi:hypothetical protein